MSHQKVTGSFPTGLAYFALNVAQRGDALELLRSLPDACATLRSSTRNTGACSTSWPSATKGRASGDRCQLPAMGEHYIDACCRAIARVLVPSGYRMRWVDTYGLCEAHHLRVADRLNCVDLIA